MVRMWYGWAAIASEVRADRGDSSIEPVLPVTAGLPAGHGRGTAGGTATWVR